MNWDGLLESFGRITTESNSTDGSLEDITRVNPLSNNTVDITELLFDNATNTKHNETNALAVDYDLTNLDAISPFEVNKMDKKGASGNSWVDVSDLLPGQIRVNGKMEVESKAMQLALANEIEVQAPWVDVSALAASISETPVSIKEKTPESIFTLATFVPTHMQSYIDLNPEIAPAANLMSQNSFDLDSPTILDVHAKVFNDSQLITNLDSSKLGTDIENFLDTTNAHTRSLDTPPLAKVEAKTESDQSDSALYQDNFLNSPDTHGDTPLNSLSHSNTVKKIEILPADPGLFSDNFLKTPEENRSLNTPPPSRVQHNIEINPANSVLFNTDLALEDTLLFDNEPPSDMYVVRTENIFGKEIAKRNALKQLAADAGICSCTECKCDPSNGECRNCKSDESESKGQCCTEDKCTCVDCKCDHSTMTCMVGCGRATDDNHNTFLHYHRRHKNSNLEELGVYTLHECDEETSIIDDLECSCKKPDVNKKGCCNSDISKESCSDPTDSCCSKTDSKSCCVTICFKKLNAFKQFLSDNDVLLQALKAHNLNLTTSI